MNGEQRAISNKKPRSNLLAWQKSIELAVAIYETTKTFPKDEIYGLTSQLHRAAVSAPSTIAEGAADRTSLSNAIGSLNEIDTQLELVLRLGYVSKAEYDRLFKILDDCIALTYGLRKTVNRKQ